MGIACKHLTKKAILQHQERASGLVCSRLPLITIQYLSYICPAPPPFKTLTHAPSSPKCTLPLSLLTLTGLIPHRLLLNQTLKNSTFKTSLSTKKHSQHIKTC